MTLSGATALAVHPPRGRVRARLEVLERRLIPPPPAGPTITGHPLPDLSGASAEEIANALLEAIDTAHPDGPIGAAVAEQAEGHRLCPRCLVTVEEASERASAGVVPPPWPDPLYSVFENELMWRAEMARWTDRPGVRFDRAARQAEQERQQAEHFYTNHYRDQIPPWVLIGEPADGAGLAG